jgi:hypothetical protein
MMYLYKINEPKFLQQSQEVKQVIAPPFFFLFFWVSQWLRLMQVNIGEIYVMCIQMSLCAVVQVIRDDHSPKSSRGKAMKMHWNILSFFKSIFILSR